MVKTVIDEEEILRQQLLLLAKSSKRIEEENLEDKLPELTSAMCEIYRTLHPVVEDNSVSVIGFSYCNEEGN